MSREPNANPSEPWNLPAERLRRLGVTEEEWRQTFGIVLSHPERCAHIVLTALQKAFLLLLIAGLAALAVFDVKFALTLANGALITFYLVVSAFKVFLIHHSLGLSREMRFPQEELDALDDALLPMYTILVPMYDEAESLPRLIDGLKSLDYPEDRLDVLLLMEEDDEKTVATARGMDLPGWARIVVTPDCEPRTKPKACNLGLARARGEYLVIFDAEDRPEPDQLKKAVLAFRSSPVGVVCVQAKLNFYNQRQNLLTRMFTIEYSTWFDLMLPGLTEIDAPLPLGGTSNHFKTRVLRRLGGWDPFNVTEDCDLGQRVAAEGYETRIIDSTTWEEACSDRGYWIRQRSRWVKGYIQTYFVFMRRPLQHALRLGLGKSIAFHLVIGGTPLSLLVNPVYWVMTLLWFVFRWEGVAELFPFPIILGGLVCLFAGNFVFVYTSILAAYRRGYYDLVKYALITPFYWLMMSVGAWKGFLQIITRPNYWEKTKHGFDLAEAASAAPETAGAAEQPRPAAP